MLVVSSYVLPSVTFDLLYLYLTGIIATIVYQDAKADTRNASLIETVSLSWLIFKAHLGDK